MSPLIIILTACANAYFVSSFHAYTREIADGGTTNRIWSFVYQYVFFSAAYAPLFILFPAAPLVLNIILYLSIALLGGLSYVASICHVNQMKRNMGQEEDVTELPFDLHNIPLFSNIMLFLNNNISYGIFALYGAGLLFCAYFAAPLFVAASLAMVLVDQCYQRGWFPAFLTDAYFYIMSYLLIGSFIGFDSLVTIGLNIINVGVSIWDYIQTHIRGARSASSQFPIATDTHQLSLEHHPEFTEGNQRELDRLLIALSRKDARVTFNHFPKAYTVSDKLLADSPRVEFQQYSDHFLQLDFTSPELRETIQNEMVLCDKFHEQSLEERAREFNLPDNTPLIDIQIAYIKKEMCYLVERLTHPSYRDLNHEQMSTLQGQARHLLAFLNTNRTPKTQEHILLSLAMRTGTHCNRVYLDTFAELSHQYAFQETSLTLKERGEFMAQTIREDRFRSYYYEFLPIMKKMNPMFETLWSDANDYHTYESFTNAFGAFFYLRNPSLSMRIRTPVDILMEKFNSFIYGLLSEQMNVKTLFSDYYTEKVLINEVLDGKLHPLFKDWCEQHWPGSYDIMILDEDQMVNKDDPKVIGLARLMLLDFDITELTEPYNSPESMPVVKHELQPPLHNSPGLTLFPQPEVPAVKSDIPSYNRLDCS